MNENLNIFVENLVNHRSCNRLIKSGEISSDVQDVFAGKADCSLVLGDCLAILKSLPRASIDCIVTSPPYFNQRQYSISKGAISASIGNERRINDYVEKLAGIFKEAHRVLAPRGSLWLNLGDKYVDKELMGVPWRVAFALKDTGWILRQDIIWNQLKGTQSAKDRMRDIYEHIFHFVKQKSYYFDDRSIRCKPKSCKYIDGKISSATGVTGKKYFQHIAASEFLSPAEKKNATEALNHVILEMESGEVVDFRMTIRGVQRTYHSNSSAVSGRAKELEDKGFFIIKMKSKGFLPSNIWNIVPEDKQRKDEHCAVFPEELLRIPILSTCPENGIVLDPFSGSGTTVVAALKEGRRGIGIDISAEYTGFACRRIIERID